MTTTRVDFDEISATYEESIDGKLTRLLGGEPPDYYLQLKAKETEDHCRRLGVEPLRSALLDVGCGTGRTVELLQPRFERVAGVEPSAGMLAEARKRGLGDSVFQLASAEALPFPNASFDVVYSSCIFHHSDAQGHIAMLREMGRVLKPGGALFTFEHNPWNPLTRWAVSYCPVDEGVTLCRPSSIRRAYRAAGLRSVETRFIVFFPRLLSRLRALEPRMHPLPLGAQYYISGRK